MGTSSSLSRTLEGGHEPYYDFPCSLCEKDGKQVEAVKYCEECFVYMCDPCVRNHNKFPLHTGHQLLYQSEFVKVVQSKPVSFPTKRCLKHPGELLNIYCGNHDVVGCSSCKVLEHGICANTKHLIDAAKGIKKSKEYQTIKQETRALLDNTVRVLSDRQADISRIEKEKQDVKKIIADFRKKVNKYFDDLEQKTLDALQDKAETIVSSCKQDTKGLTVMKTTAEDMLKQQESFKGENECDLFVQVKTGKKFLSNAMQELLNISKKIQKDAINFRTDQKIEPYLSSLEVLGTFTDMPMSASQLSPAATDTHRRQSRTSTPSSQMSPDNCAPHPNPETQMYGKFDVKGKSESCTCDITDICLLSDGTFLIADYSNKSLKRLNQSYNIVDSLRLPSNPSNVCNVGSNEVAVSLPNSMKVRYITVKKKMKLTLSRSLCTGNDCKGMAYVDGKLYVCCGNTSDMSSGCIKAYNKSGLLQFTIRTLSSVPEYITLTDDGQHFLVTTHLCDDITMMDLTGNVVKTFIHRDLSVPSAICSNGQGKLFILGWISGNVVLVQFEPEQQKMDVILAEKYDFVRPMPQAICYDINCSRLIVGRDCNYLLVLKHEDVK